MKILKRFLSWVFKCIPAYKELEDQIQSLSTQADSLDADFQSLQINFHHKSQDLDRVKEIWANTEISANVYPESATRYGEQSWAVVKLPSKGGAFIKFIPLNPYDTSQIIEFLSRYQVPDNNIDAYPSFPPHRVFRMDDLKK